MKESSNSQNDASWIESLLEPGFTLPDGDDFRSVSATMTYAQFLELSERHLPAYNSNPIAQRLRFEQKVDDPFILFD